MVGCWHPFPKALQLPNQTDPDVLDSNIKPRRSTRQNYTPNRARANSPTLEQYIDRPARNVDPHSRIIDAVPGVQIPLGHYSITPVTPDNLKRSAKLFRVLAFVIRKPRHQHHSYIL